MKLCRNSALEHEIAQKQVLEDDRRNLILRLEVTEIFMKEHSHLHVRIVWPQRHGRGARYRGARYRGARYREAVLNYQY